MGTTFVLWSASAAPQEGRPGVAGGDGGYLLSQGAGGTVGGADMAQSREEMPAPRASKKKKKHAAAPKRPPQRGLGVEKLERLRLQERWRKMTEIEPSADERQMQETPGAGAIHEKQLMMHYAVGAQCQAPHSPFGVCNGFPVYDPQHQAGVSRVSLSRFAAAPAPVGYGGAWGESCFLQRHSVLGAGRVLGNCGAIPPVRPTAFQDHSGVDPFPMGTADARFQVASSTPSVSQRLQCSDECDICIRKRMLEGRLLWTSCGDGGSALEKTPLYLFGTADRKSENSAEGHVSALEVKEYEFFPCSSSNSTSTAITSAYPGGGWSGGGGDAELGTRNNVGVVPSTTPSASACSSKQLDLTLKLSC